MRIPIQVSLNQPEPLYYQIESQLRTLIMGGQILPGTLLPSIRELAQDLTCSVITIRRVYQDLEKEGLLRTRQGTGTFVADIADQDKERHRNHAVIEALGQAVETARNHHYEDDEIIRMLKELLDRKVHGG